MVIYVSCLSCVLGSPLQPCGHLLGKGWPLGSSVRDVCVFVTFPCGALGQVWYLIASNPDLCLLTYFYSKYISRKFTNIKETYDTRIAFNKSLMEAIHT